MMLRFTLTLDVSDLNPQAQLRNLLLALASDLNAGELLIDDETGMGVTNHAGQEIGWYTCKPTGK